MASSLPAEHSILIDTPGHLVRLQIEGELGAERLTAIMHAIASDERYRRGMNAIADFRGCSANWDYSEMQRFRDYVVRVGGSRQRRWAIVVRPGALEALARLVILISEAVGASIEMRLFDDPEQALQWVQGEPETNMR